MSAFMNAMVQAQARTANGAVTNYTTGDKCLNLFSQIGSSRGKDLTSMFQEAYTESPDWAVRILQWARDIRGGAGEREQFIRLLKFLANRHEVDATVVLMNTPEIGRFKDVVAMIDSPIGEAAVAIMVDAIAIKGNGLAAKWAPRKGKEAGILAKAMSLTAKEYRQLVVGLSNTVEQKMCARQWDGIDFGKLPSVASARYQKAFLKNANSRYVAYLESLKKGDAKINASAVYPYDMIKSLRNGSSVAADAQWKAQRDWMAGSTENVIAMVDVSGSMSCPTAVAGLSAMDIAISLGLYIGERSRGVFQNEIITFDDNPCFYNIKQKGDNLKAMVEHLSRAPWGGSTNFTGAFDIILDRAVRNRVPQSDMPTMMVVLSDMEFNMADGGYSRRRYGVGEQTNFESIKAKYRKAGYEMPKLVFWNLCPRPTNNPVTKDDNGTALVSGFSPSIMETILSAKDFNPLQIMLDKIMSDRYVGIDY
ncbi:hypothetical protein phiAS5_ORF0290 [Aeromonas phage phiAS5]|uniref:DUF2828 domain-containing protein n=1 Tax=Aeromonas phage phiAS5 TaxID=879630 RepID=E1A244_9CAUD|nr:RNA-binding protein [Aeromonas phage phiAS5]ADM80133.1 hypothetical protein phiAS5_ORF0290 [Aeromonas phage phiAS5]BES53105.1 hypothetical protein [Aeromonas phage phiWae14]